MTQTGKIIVLGLSLSSSWGNGHATTFRALLRGVKDAGSYHVQFLERDVPWYGRQRDLLVPDFCDLDFYSSLGELMDRYSHQFIEADAIVIGSYVPDGVKVIDAICALQPCRLCFYDIDTPVTLAKLDRGDEEYIARRQIPCLTSTSPLLAGGRSYAFRTNSARSGLRRFIVLSISIFTEIPANARNGILAILVPIAATGSRRCKSS